MAVQVRPASAGGWLAFVSGPRLLVVDAPADLVDAAWSAIGAVGGFQATLDLLTSNGLAATPPFALVEWESGKDARLIVRGVTVTVTDAAGAQQLSGAGISTWVERIMPGVTAIALAVPGATAAGTGSLPLESGVALVAEARSARGAALGRAAQPSSRTAPETAPEPVVADIEATVVAAPDDGATVSEIPVSAPETPAEGYDYLFGDTMYRSVADAAVRAPEPDDAGEASAGLGGDHDGHTVMTSDIAKLRGQRRTRGAAASAPVPVAPALVLVVSTTGAREPLTQPILVGRAPSVSKVSGGKIPRLVTIGADQDISRNHAQFSLEGGTVVVTDLHSKNGTSVVLPGKPAQKLRAGEPTSVIVGTVVDLGGGLTLTVDED